MKYPISKEFFVTDNSLECDENTFFLETKTSSKYKSDAFSRNCKGILLPQDLKSYFSNSIKVIGITGTNGKTTTASLISFLLMELGFKVALQGTRGFFINGENIDGKSLTTPQLLTTIYNIDRSCKNRYDFFIMEVSSHAIEQQRVEEIEFALKILTNITSDHLDYHGSVEEYRKIKNDFFVGGGLKLINGDDDFYQGSKDKLYSFGMKKENNFYLKNYKSINGLEGEIVYEDNNCCFHSSMVGDFNLYNILGAVSAISLLTSKSLHEIGEKIENFCGVAGRMEVVSKKPLIFLDFAHTEDGVYQVLNALKGQKVVTVVGAGGDRDKSKRAKMGKIASEYSVRVYITSDNPRSENPEEIVDDIIEGVKKEKEFVKIVDRKDAIKEAIANLKNDEILAVLGRGDETHQEINGTFIPFRDKEVILQYLGRDT